MASRAWLSGARQITMSTVALQSDYRDALDFRERHAGQSCCSGTFLGPAPTSAAVPAGDPVLSRAGTGGKFVYQHRPLSFLWNRGFWRLGCRHRRIAATLDVGLIVLGIASYYASMLLVAATPATVSRARAELASLGVRLLDTVLYRRNSCRSCRTTESGGTVLRDRIRTPVNVGSERRSSQPAQHDFGNQTAMLPLVIRRMLPGCVPSGTV